MVNVEAVRAQLEDRLSASWEDLIGTALEALTNICEGTLFDPFCISQRKRDHQALLWGEYLDRQEWAKLTGRDWMVPAFVSVVYLGGPALEVSKRLKDRRKERERDDLRIRADPDETPQSV